MSDTPNKKHAGERSDRNINAGHNRAEDVTLAKIERTNKLGINGNENMMIVDNKGKVVLDTAHSPFFKRTKKSVKSSPLGTLMVAKASKDAIITHSHPNKPKAGLAGAISNTLSDTDVINAVLWNAKEIRATTPTYTYSMKRPKGGWGATPGQVHIAMGKPGGVYQMPNGSFVAKGGTGLYGEAIRKAADYINKHGPSESNQARVNTVYQHQAMQKLAKKFGWNYTRKKNA